jgi:hypothetical protein
MSCLARTSATVRAEDVHRRELAVDGEVDGLVECGGADGTGDDEGCDTLGDMTGGGRKHCSPMFVNVPGTGRDETP